MQKHSMQDPESHTSKNSSTQYQPEEPSEGWDDIEGQDQLDSADDIVLCKMEYYP